MKAIGSRIEEFHKVPGAIKDHEKCALIITIDEHLMPIGSMSQFVSTNYPDLYRRVKDPMLRHNIEDSSIEVMKLSGNYNDKYSAVFALTLYRSTSPLAEKNTELMRDALDMIHRCVRYEGLSRVIMPRVGADCGVSWLFMTKPIVEEIFADMNVSISY